MATQPRFGGRRALPWTKGVCISAKTKKAGRGYGYVGASRFRSREGCFLFGRIRRTDFLPVGEPQEDEVIERGILSESSDEDDGPQDNWSNPLAGRMHGFDDDDDDDESASSEGEAPVCEADAEQGEVVHDNDFL